MAQKVILDTNFFLLPYQNKMDIFRLIDRVLDSPHSYVVCSSIVRELERIAKNRGKTGAAARLGLKIMEMQKGRIELIETRRPADSWIIDYAEKNRLIVCTNDKQLKNKLKQKGIRVITAKGKDWLGFV